MPNSKFGVYEYKGCRVRVKALEQKVVTTIHFWLGVPQRTQILSLGTPMVDRNFVFRVRLDPVIVGPCLEGQGDMATSLVTGITGVISWLLGV